MTFCVETECSGTLPFAAGETGRLVAEEVLRQEECPYSCAVNLLLTDDKRIRALNREHRGIDRATDVLSFPALAFTKPAVFPERDALEVSAIDFETGDVWLGDIVVSVERAVAQAESYGHSVRREFAFLVAHSMLHLLGYDHMTEKESAEMEEHAERALHALGITRDAQT